jgi:hypothetical protein
MTTLRSLAAIGLVGLAVVACSKKTPEPVASPVVKPVSAADQAKAAEAKAQAEAKANREGGDGKLDPNDPKHGTRKLMGLDVAVYVDGKQAGVLRFGELPTSMQPIELEGGAKRFRVYDYLKGIGVDPATVKSVHFHAAGDQIGSVEGTELRKEKDRFVFGYISGTTGAPQTKWDTDGLKNEFNVHEIRRVSVFVKKPVPKIHPGMSCHVAADGECDQGVPYVDKASIAKGTRVYLDGKMVGFVKRRNVGEALSLGKTDSGEEKYSVAKLAAQMGVDPASIKSVEMLAGDDVIARSTGEQFLKLATDTYFTLPAHNHGKVRVHVPVEFQAKEEAARSRDALVSAILLFKSDKPSSRDLVAISEDTDLSVQLAAIDDAQGKLGRGEQ